MRLALPVAVVLLAVSLVAPALAGHSTSVCTNVTTVGVAPAALYHVEDPWGGTWIYLEANDHPGLQQGGSAWWEIGTGGVDQPCWDREIATGEPIPDPDLIVL